MARSLYICYFGITQPLVQTQVIPYLRELVKGGHELTLLTFEPHAVDEAAVRGSLKADGIEWHWLRYHKRPSVPATLFDIANGARFIRNFANAKKFDILHCRSHVPMMMASIARKSIRHKPKLLFDIRGFFPEEYVDAGIWKEGGAVYRNVKRAEAWLMKEADGFVVLTEKAREILFPESEQSGSDRSGRPVEVIPCCVDLSRFASANRESRDRIRRELHLGKRPVAAYVGAFGGWYMTEETADLFGVLKEQDPDSFAMILTQSPRDLIEPLLRARGFGETDYLIKQVPAAEIPAYLSAADIAISLIKPCYSKQASSPTKNAEYLACGLPIIANAGVGDVEMLIEGQSAGALLRAFSKADYVLAVERVRALADDRERIAAISRAEFDLHEVGGARYRILYDKLTNTD